MQVSGRKASYYILLHRLKVTAMAIDLIAIQITFLRARDCYLSRVFLKDAAAL